MARCQGKAAPPLEPVYPVGVWGKPLAASHTGQHLLRMNLCVEPANAWLQLRRRLQRYGGQLCRVARRGMEGSCVIARRGMEGNCVVAQASLSTTMGGFVRMLFARSVHSCHDQASLFVRWQSGARKIGFCFGNKLIDTFLAALVQPLFSHPPTMFRCMLETAIV